MQPKHNKLSGKCHTQTFTNKFSCQTLKKKRYVVLGCFHTFSSCDRSALEPRRKERRSAQYYIYIYIYIHIACCLLAPGMEQYGTARTVRFGTVWNGTVCALCTISTNVRYVCVYTICTILIEYARMPIDYSPPARCGSVRSGTVCTVCAACTVGTTCAICTMCSVCTVCTICTYVHMYVCTYVRAYLALRTHYLALSTQYLIFNT